MLAWPKREVVHAAVGRWAARVAAARPEVRRVGYFGSYARGDWGVGSDLDLIVVVDRAAQPFARRAADWDVTALPVPADLVVYTQAEWDRLAATSRFGVTVCREAVWVYSR